MSDLIDRQAAIDAMCEACSDWCDEGVCKKVSAIQKLPSTQPDTVPVKHGYITLKTIYGRDRVSCSVCGYEYTRMDGDFHNYCPNCGANMRGEQNE